MHCMVYKYKLERKKEFITDTRESLRNSPGPGCWMFGSIAKIDLQEERHALP